jgi:hypothetical protein
MYFASPSYPTTTRSRGVNIQCVFYYTL